MALYFNDIFLQTLKNSYIYYLNTANQVTVANCVPISFSYLFTIEIHYCYYCITIF